MKIIALYLWVIVCWFGFALVMAPLVWLLWNWLMVSLFEWPSVSLVETAGLLVLAGCFRDPPSFEMSLEQ